MPIGYSSEILNLRPPSTSILALYTYPEAREREKGNWGGGMRPHRQSPLILLVEARSGKGKTLVSVGELG
jgi:hypothetical protein